MITPIDRIRAYLHLIEDNVYGADVWIEGIREQLRLLDASKDEGRVESGTLRDICLHFPICKNIDEHWSIYFAEASDS